MADTLSTENRFQAALCYTAALHAEQRRKFAGEPYVAHLLAVAAMVMEHGGDEDEAIAALLHDAVEDQGGAATREEIARRFGEHVAQIVDGCTDTAESPKPPWRERKEAFIARLGHATPSVRLVVAADKLHNARAILREHRRLGQSLWSHFRSGREGTLWYYRTVVETLRRAETTALVEELDETVRQLERLA
jgi:(p)ppGpp synthase/HD superfamily hydrolase